MSVAGNEDAIETACRRYAINIGGIPKGTHSMAAIYPAIDMAGYPMRCLRHHLRNLRDFNLKQRIIQILQIINSQLSIVNFQFKKSVKSVVKE